MGYFFKKTFLLDFVIDPLFPLFELLNEFISQGTYFLDLTLNYISFLQP